LTGVSKGRGGRSVEVDDCAGLKLMDVGMMMRRYCCGGYVDYDRNDIIDDDGSGG
jgi:hypothetical protein